LTRWRISARSVDASTRVGSAEAKFRTRKQLSIRATPPRFLRKGDEVTIPVLLRNLSKRDMTVDWTVTASDEEGGHNSMRSAALAAGATAARAFGFHAARTGDVTVRAKVIGPAAQDALEAVFPVHPQGIPTARGGSFAANLGSATVFRVPPHAEPDSIECRITIESTYVNAIVNALPYLMDYPHGCTEQTMSRFTPLLDVQAAIAALGLPVKGRLEELPKMLAAGLGRLGQLQHDDGGFGWWESDESSVDMTALVVRGLNRVIENDPDNGTASNIRQNAVAWLKARTQKPDVQRAMQLETLAAVQLALVGARSLPSDKSVREAVADRMHAASPLTQALFLRAINARPLPQTALELRSALEAWLRSPPTPPDDAGEVSTWHDDPIQTTAEVLHTLLLTGGDPKLIDAGAHWLVLHREGGDHWRSTRDTAAAVRFLAAYVAKGRPLDGSSRFTVLNGDETLGEVTLTRDALFTDEATITVPKDKLAPGSELSLTLRSENGKGVATVVMNFVETGPAIEKGGYGLDVTRRYYRLDPVEADGKVTWTRTLVTETVPSGTLLESEIEIATDTAREYVMVTDLYAGGFEPARDYGMQVEGRAEALNTETQRYDDRTLFFITHLPKGKTTLRHLVRATHVGSFTALPALAELMYFPRVRGNSKGEALEITAAGPTGKGGAK